jgi:putative oxidoreductase
MLNERSSTQKLNAPPAPGAIVLLRTAIAFVFITEGIQKFLYPDALGVGRFAKIGIPSPDMTAPFVGGVEIVCGALILIGLLTRLAAFALLIDMIVAIASTKIPILLGHGYWRFADPTARPGFWTMAHEARTDIAMLLGCAVLISLGADGWSLDRRLARRAS